MYESENIEALGPIVNMQQDSNYQDKLLASIPVAQVVINGKTLQILHCNSKFAENTGFSEDELLPGRKTFADLICSRQYERFRLQVQEAADNPASGDKYTVYDLKDKHDNYRSYFVHVYPADSSFDNDDRYHVMLLPNISQNIGYISFDTRELLSDQFTGEDFGTFEWLPDKDLVFWSDGIYHIYEVDKSIKDISVQLSMQFIHEDDRERAATLMAETIATGLPAELEMKIVTSAKKEKIVHCLVRCMANNDGRVIKLLGSIRDITNRRAVENDVKKRVDDLNRSNRELEEFAYVASHDLQEPLRKISTFSDRLNDKYANVITGDGAMYLERVMASAENMRQLINNLLEFSRISKSTQPFLPVNLGFVLHQVKSDLELTIEETGTTINNGSLPTVVGSMSQLKQLFDNIINNAIKFRKPDTTPVISISANVLSKEEQKRYELRADTPYFKIEITDNGIGFEKEYATRIFQVFQRLHGKSEYPGSGIGLAICKKIVEHHNGIIFAESAEGQGAKFTFMLPEHQANQ